MNNDPLPTQLWLPRDLYAAVVRYVESTPGLTMEQFLTAAIENELATRNQLQDHFEQHQAEQHQKAFVQSLERLWRIA